MSKRFAVLFTFEFPIIILMIQNYFQTVSN